MPPITTAVILAAGLGMRLRDSFSGKPKGLLSIGGVPLVERSIQQLMAHGIHDIILCAPYTTHLTPTQAACIRSIAPVMPSMDPGGPGGADDTYRWYH